jgi:histidine ammonia-lyase
MVSCNGQEDHVSMAANAATKARRVVLNLERLLAIELMVSVQALEYRRPQHSAAAIEYSEDGEVTSLDEPSCGSSSRGVGGG